MTDLRVTEIYPSIQGESMFAGWPCVFVRLTGCPLRCTWCDTVYSFTEGTRRSLDAIVSEAVSFGLPLVEVTGGEPLAQKGAPALLTALADRFETVLLETSGSFPVHELDPRVRIILDLKAPGSGEERRNHWENLEVLTAKDEVKIVLADRTDYEWARRIVGERDWPEGLVIHFSPVHGQLDAQALSEWMLEDRLRVHLQLQQHKFIWHPEARGV